MPSCFSASSRPLFASALNERSLRPPMSVTSPTFRAFFELLELDAEPEELDEPEPELSLEPHAATTSESPASANTALRFRRVANNEFPPPVVLGGGGQAVTAASSPAPRREIY